MRIDITILMEKIFIDRLQVSGYEDYAKWLDHVEKMVDKYRLVNEERMSKPDKDGQLHIKRL